MDWAGKTWEEGMALTRKPDELFTATTDPTGSQAQTARMNPRAV